MRYLCLILILSGCTLTPNRYGQLVLVIGGQYKGQRGKLIKDCNGIENYLVELRDNKRVCIRVWNLERWYYNESNY